MEECASGTEGGVRGDTPPLCERTHLLTAPPPRNRQLGVRVFASLLLSGFG